MDDAGPGPGAETVEADLRFAGGCFWARDFLEILAVHFGAAGLFSSSVSSSVIKKTPLEIRNALPVSQVRACLRFLL